MLYQKTAKIKNKNKIFKYMIQKKEFNKQDIVDKLNLTFPTVTKYIDEFLELEIIKKEGMKLSKNNRPSMTYKFNEDSLYSIGIKIEVNRITFIIINILGEIIKKEEINNNFYKIDYFSQYIIHQLKIFLKNFKEKNKIMGIGISLPGIVNDVSKVFEIGTNFRLFSQDMKVIEKVMELPVYLINEGNGGAFGEYILNKYKYKNIGYISIDTGIGAGIILQGQLYEGENFKAGEIGHISIDFNGKECSCGNRGCLERYCSNTGLLEEFNKVFNLTLENIGEIFFKELHKEQKGKEILEKYVINLSHGLQNFILLFDLNKIIIGGEICNYIEYFHFQEELEKNIFNNLFCKDKTILSFSKYGNESNLIGAGLLPFKELLL